MTLLGKPVNSLSDGFYKINDLVFLYSENQNLKQENNSLNKWKDLALELLAENEELKKGLEVIDKMEWPVKAGIQHDFKPKIETKNEVDEDMKKGLQVLNTLKGNDDK